MSLKKFYTVFLLSASISTSIFCYDGGQFNFEGGDDIGSGQLRQRVEDRNQGGSEGMNQNSGCGEWDQEPSL